MTAPLLVMLPWLAACEGGGEAVPADAGWDALQPTAFDADAAMAEWVDLWAGYDLDRLSDLFVWDSDLTYLSSESEGLITGPQAVWEHHEAMGFVSGGKPAEQELWVDQVVGRVRGMSAVVTAVWYFGDRSQPAASGQRGPMTAVYTWSGDRWRIAHMHFANYEASDAAGDGADGAGGEAGGGAGAGT